MKNQIQIDDEYKAWIKQISADFKRSQIKAASHVNTEMLKFYWRLGQGIEREKKKYDWGSKFYDQISLDLKRELPEIHSFSPRNLLYMNQYYRMFPDLEITKQDVSQSKEYESTKHIVSQSSPIFSIPWGHMVQILNKCKDNQAKALFYINKVLENNWSRAVLLNFLDTDLYERQGKAVSNFDKRLPDLESDLAQQMTKDPYNFDFLTLREQYDEKELKDALMSNIQHFLLELGTGFAFLGREYRLVVGDTEQFIDMLFYNVALHCYVVIEVKTRAFDPGDMGQLGTYVAAVDGILRREGDNQSIGLLICKTKNNVLAKYALSSTNVPIGISEYELSNLIPDDFKSSMPTIEEIEDELKG